MHCPLVSNLGLTMRINQRLLNYFLPVLAVVLLALGVVLPEVARADAFPTTQSGSTTYYTGGSYNYNDAVSSAVSWATTAGAAYATRPSTVRTIAGGAATVVARAAPAVGAVGSLVAGCFANPLCVVATAAATAYVANELYYNYSLGPDGLPVITKPPENACTVATCYSVSLPYAPYPVGRGNTPEAACRNLEPLVKAAWGADRTTWLSGTMACGVLKAGVFSITVSTVTPAVNSPATPAELASAIGAKTNWSDSSQLPRLIKEIVSVPPAANWSPSVPLQAPTITGPTSIDLGPPVVTTRADGSKTTVTKTSSLGYYGPGVSLPVRPGTTMGTYGPAVDVVETTVTAEATPAGVTTTTSTQTGGGTVVGSSPEIKLETCGLPGKPACIMSEVGTPSPVAVTQYDAAADGYKAKADENRTVISGATDKPFFSGWNVFFSAPAVVPCEPMVLPSYKGVSMGSLDACNVVGGVRDVMAYLWAFSGLFLCLGMVKKVV